MFHCVIRGLNTTMAIEYTKLKSQAETN